MFKRVKESFNRALRELQKNLKREFHESFTLQESFKRASRELQEGFKRASRELQGSFKRATREHQESFKKLLESFYRAITE